MSYCRFSEGDVYLFPTTVELDAALIECCICRFSEGRVGSSRSVFFDTRSSALQHLRKHREAGHQVPQRAFDRLREEIKTLGDELNDSVGS